MTVHPVSQLPSPVLSHLRDLGLRESMINDAVASRVTPGWVLHFPPDVRCPPVLVGDDGGHQYFDPSVDDAAVADQYMVSHRLLRTA